MARVRLFANLRELAGASSVEVSASTVQGVLDETIERYGDSFRAGLQHARIWVNGDPAEPSDAVASDDEVALLPPVSGGSDVTPELRLLGPLTAAIVLLAANAMANPVWFVVALVGVAATWSWDVAEYGAIDRDVMLVPMLVAVLGGAIIPYAWLAGGGGSAGLGLVMILPVFAVFIQAVFIPKDRDLTSIATAVTASTLAALGVGSLVLARVATTSGQNWLWVFLLMVIGGRGVASFLIHRESGTMLDPLSGSVVATVVMGIVGALVWNLNGFAVFLLAIVVAVALIIGAAFTSMLRVRDVYFTQALPGVLSDVGASLAAAVLFLPVARLLLRV